MTNFTFKPNAARRSYAQFCPAARALDVLGSRWTILIVREMLLGPKRYTDLLTGLPGIGPNVLAKRLRELRDAGVTRRTELPPPAASSVYELTELGEGLRPVVNEIARWGLNFLDTPRPDDRFQLGWVLGCMQASFRPELARGVRESYEFRIDGDVFHITVDDGKMEVRHGPAVQPACAITADLATFMAVGGRLMAPREARERGLLKFEGDADAAARSIAILGPHLEATGGEHGIIGAVRARFRPDAALGIRETYQFLIGATAFHARVDDGNVEMHEGPADDPAAILHTDLGTLLALGAHRMTIGQAIAADAAEVSGNSEATMRMGVVFGLSASEFESI